MTATRKPRKRVLTKETVNPPKPSIAVFRREHPDLVDAAPFFRETALKLKIHPDDHREADEQFAYNWTSYQIWLDHIAKTGTTPVIMEVNNGGKDGRK